jgi:5'-3' exonuclease
MGTILKHPATKDALIENVPVIECLLMDYNANIHYILQKTIIELNEILYYTYHHDNNIKNMLKSTIFNHNDYNLDLELPIEEIEDKIDYYNDLYNLGTTYQEIHKKLIANDFLSDIIFHETINYTRLLISSLNRGWIKKVFLALDGTPSMAKIREQRNRRYIGAHMNNIKEEITRKYKHKNNDIYQIDLFGYRSMICTGTKFMEKIQQALFHLDINLDIEVSTLNIKGEGEKKIIKAMEEYSSYNSFCVMSPDSDMLILIGLLSNNEKFSGKKLYNFRIDYQRKNSYQFFDLGQLLNNFQNYFSKKINREISLDKMLDLFFMLVVFGNDFLPKLEPLDITQHFDFVCESCLKISTSDLNFISNGELNYKYLLEFFKLINNEIIEMAIEHSLNTKYNNYLKLCKNMSISEEDITKCNNYHNDLEPFNVNFKNFAAYLKIINNAYSKLINYLKETIIPKESVSSLYQEIHTNPLDSYLLLILPKILFFPGACSNLSPDQFFERLVEYTNSAENFTELKFRNKLMLRNYNLQTSKCSKSTVSAYISETEKMNKSLEPYRTIFHMTDINLVSFNLLNGELVDLRPKYYETYVKSNISKNEIDKLVFDYIIGIEWLYQYYITGKHLEWSGWQYNHTQPPLIDDIIDYLETHEKCHEEVVRELSSYGENNMSPNEHYLYVTPNEYTNAGVSPNLSDVLHLIDGNGALFLNKCQIKWHEYDNDNQ